MLSRYDLSVWDVVAQGWRKPVRSRFLLAQAVGPSLHDFVINAQDTFDLAHWVNFSESPWH
jgi:hypothetical protein